MIERDPNLEDNIKLLIYVLITFCSLGILAFSIIIIIIYDLWIRMN
jgi:hypothetical protein